MRFVCYQFATCVCFNKYPKMLSLSALFFSIPKPIDRWFQISTFLNLYSLTIQKKWKQKPEFSNQF